MIISPGLARPPLVPLAFGSCRCCCPVLLCCILMLACGLLADPVHVEPITSECIARPAASLLEANGIFQYNLTEVTEDGRWYQIVKNELQVPGESQLCQQVEYLLPAPGPRLLILVNFTRIDSSDSPSLPDNDVNDTVNPSSNDTSSSGGGGYLHQLSTESGQLEAPVESSSSLQQATSRSGARKPNSHSPGRDMLAVDDVRRQRLHHSEGDQLKQTQPVDSLEAAEAYRASDTSPEAPFVKGRLLSPGDTVRLDTFTPVESTAPKTAKVDKDAASETGLTNLRTKWQDSITVNDSVQSVVNVSGSDITRQFPSLEKTTASQHTSLLSRASKVQQRLTSDTHRHLPVSLNDEKLSLEVRGDNVVPVSSHASEAVDLVEEPLTVSSLRPKEKGVSALDRRDNSVSTNGSPQHQTSDSFELGNTSDIPNKDTSHSHSEHLLEHTFEKSSTVASFPQDESLSTTKSFSARDSLDQSSPTVSLLDRDIEQGVDLTTQVPDHTDYSQDIARRNEPIASQDCSLKVIIEETDPHVQFPVDQADQTRFGTQEEKQRAQPQVICWQAGWENEGRSPLVYRYTAPIKITYLWTDKKPSRLSLQFSIRSLDEVECHFQCSTTPHLCLVQQQLCDGYTDCPDLSDELPNVCDSALRQGSTGKGTKVPNVIASVVIPCGFVIIIIVVFLMIKQKLLGHSARRSGDSLLSPPQSHSSEACRSSQDSDQNEALLPDRPPPYSQLQQEQEQQQHQQLLTYTGAGVVSSLQPIQLPSAQHRQYLLPEQQQQQQQDQQKLHHHTQFPQLQHSNNNSSGHNINNNDLPGAVSYHQQQDYQLPQQHMLLQQQPLPPQSGNSPRDKAPPPLSSLVFTGNSSITTSSHGVVAGYQQHLYTNPLSNNDNDDDSGDNSGHFFRQHPQPQHHQPHQRNQSQQRLAKPSQPVTSPVQATSGFSTMSVLPLQPQQCPPHIPVSLDGEEGYSAAQRSLHSKRQIEQNLEAEYGLFRAPPNRSALERDSPPPPYSLQPPSSTSFSLDSLLSGSYFSSSCPTSFTSSSSSYQSPGTSRGGNRGRGAGGHSQVSPSPHYCASSTSTNRH